MARRGCPVNAVAETPALWLIESALSLLDRQAEDTAGLWPHAVVLLARQGLEAALQTYWSLVAPGMEECSARAQLLSLREFLGEPTLAGRAHEAWIALSRASHHHVYDLPPTDGELRRWCATVREVIDRTEQVWRR